MKRNVIISGEFSINELTNTTAAQGATKTSLPRKAQERIEALRKAGIDTSNLFAMGEEMVVRVENGVPSQVADDDPIFAKIGESGFIGNYKLYRRWVMAQMFRMLRDMERYRYNMNKYIQRFHGYEYQWSMVEKELLDQWKMSKHGDFESFRERNRWFNQDVVVKMCEDYMKKLREYVDRLTTRSCKGQPYKTIRGTHYFTKDLQGRIYCPLRLSIKDVENANTPQALYEAVKRFNHLRVVLHWDVKLSDAFINAYKGAGGFFTMKNLVMFHDCRFYVNGKRTTVNWSLDKLNLFAQSYQFEGWRMIGVMKDLMEANNISVERKLKEWSDAKKK